MTVTRVPVERIFLISEKPLPAVLEAVEPAIGHPEMDGFWAAVCSARTVAELAAVVTPNLAANGLMKFGEFDDGRFIAIGQSAARQRRRCVC